MSNILILFIGMGIGIVLAFLFMGWMLKEDKNFGESNET